MRQTLAPALLLTLATAVAAPAAASEFPVTVESCGRSLTFESGPERAVVHDINMAEIMFALELQPRMVGLTGITGWYKTTPEFDAARGDLPELAPKYPNVETLLSVEPDLFFAGWYYGMKPGGELTPASLDEFGIPVYELSESCIHLGEPQPPVSMETLYRDVRNIGAIFGVAERAERLIAGWSKQVDSVAASVADKLETRVFLYDSGEDKPFTAGAFAMPTALIAAAGGRNVMDGVETSWGRVGWEAVGEQDPEFIVLLDYGDGGQPLIEFLEAHPVMAETAAVRNGRYLALKYSEITPGPANISAIEKLARAMHPSAF